MSKEAIRRAVDLFDASPSRFAAAIGPHVSRQNVQHWLATGRVPTDYCARIEAVTEHRVTRRDLRPVDWRDIWPELVAHDCGQQFEHAP
jgi:DNA-binding transcriptional regulator YdaS (Cro superfamily)